MTASAAEKLNKRGAVGAQALAEGEKHLVIRRYPKYRVAESRWFEEIPASWDALRAKWLFSNEKDRSDESDEQLAASQKYGVIPQRKMIELNNANVMLALKGTENFKKVRRNDFVISLRSFEGGIEHSLYDGCISPAYTVLRQRSHGVEPSYFRYVLKCAPFIKALNSTSEGIRDGKNITYEEFGELILALPPAEDQGAIANYLDRETARIDNLIAEKQNFINLLKEKRQALISHVVTKGLDPKVKMKDSGIEWIGEVPEHWVVRKLKYAATIQSGIPKGKDLSNKETISVPMLRVANVQDGYLDLDDVHQIEIEPSELERYSLQYGDVLMNEGGDNDKLGRGAVWREQITPCIHQNHVFAIRTHGVEPEWLELLTQSSYAKFHFFYSSKQSTNLASISSTNIKLTPLVAPPIEERKAIIDYLRTALNKSDALFDEVAKSVELLKEHRTALISAAVTGKIDVRNH